MNFSEKLGRNINSEGKLTALPSKRKMRLYALIMLASKFEAGRKYTEKEVNGIINENTAFTDPENLRRELIANKFFNRKKDGSEYWLEEVQPVFPELEM